MSPKPTTPQQDLLRGIWRENPVLLHMLGLCTLDLGRAQEAVALLSKYVQRNPRDASAHKLVAEAHDRLGNEAASHAALAENRYHTGRLDVAIQHLEHAQRVDDADYYLGSRIDARLEVFRAEHAARVRRR